LSSIRCFGDDLYERFERIGIMFAARALGIDSSKKTGFFVRHDNSNEGANFAARLAALNH
jgi:hypothetical protein